MRCEAINCSKIIGYIESEQSDFVDAWYLAIADLEDVDTAEEEAALAPVADEIIRTVWQRPWRSVGGRTARRAFTLAPPTRQGEGNRPPLDLRLFG